MNGNNIVLDTNTVLYLLNGDLTLGKYLHEKNIYISFISELELLGYKDITEIERNAISVFLDVCSLLDINQGIKDIVINLRSKYTIKLPDAIVIATSIFLGIPLLTADKKINKVEEATIILYEVEPSPK